MIKNEFPITNKSVIISSLAVAGLYLVFRIATAISGNYPVDEYSALDYFTVVFALLVLLVDLIDLYKLSTGKLRVIVTEKGIEVFNFMFIHRVHDFKDIKNANLREKDLEIFFKDGKKRYLAGPTQSDLIRLMKIIKEGTEGEN